MDHYPNSNRSSAPQGRRTTFPLGLFQRKSQFGDPNSNSNSNSNHITNTNTNTGWTGSTENAGWEPQPEPTINTTGGWVRPTLAGWALPADKPLGDGVAVARMGQTMAEPKTKPVLAGLFKRKNSSIDSREAVTRMGQTMAEPKTKPVRAGLFKGKNGIIDSREAVNKYGGKFIFK